MPSRVSGTAFKQCYQWQLWVTNSRIHPGKFKWQKKKGIDETALHISGISRRARKPNPEATQPGMMLSYSIGMALRKTPLHQYSVPKTLRTGVQEIRHCQCPCISPPSILAKDWCPPTCHLLHLTSKSNLGWALSQSPGHRPVPWPQSSLRYAFSDFHIEKVSNHQKFGWP